MKNGLRIQPQRSLIFGFLYICLHPDQIQRGNSPGMLGIDRRQSSAVSVLVSGSLVSVSVLLSCVLSRSRGLTTCEGQERHRFVLWDIYAI